MRLTILAVGRLRDGPERLLADAYLERARGAGRGLGIRSIDEQEVAAGGGSEAEGQRLMSRLPTQGVILRLDEGGENLPSATLASRLGRWRDGAQPSVSFLIGGAAGYSDAIRERVPGAIAFGLQTWPHRLVRVMLAEQVYRAMTILAGTPYHKA